MFAKRENMLTRQVDDINAACLQKFDHVRALAIEEFFFQGGIGCGQRVIQIDHGHIGLLVSRYPRQ